MFCGQETGYVPAKLTRSAEDKIKMESKNDNETLYNTLKVKILHVQIEQILMSELRSRQTDVRTS